MNEAQLGVPLGYARKYLTWVEVACTDKYSNLRYAIYNSHYKKFYLNVSITASHLHPSLKIGGKARSLPFE